MGIIRVVAISGISLTLMALVMMLVSSVLSINVYFVAGVVIAGIYILGLVVGIIGGVKLLPRIRPLENNNEKAIGLLVDDINKSRSTIKIVGGAASPRVYNDKRVKDAFKNAIQRGVKIQTVFSGDLEKTNTIAEFAMEGTIELYKPNVGKVPRNHFRVMDKISVYSEKEHNVDDIHRHSQRFDNISNIAIRFENAFDNITDNSEMLYTK